MNRSLSRNGEAAWKPLALASALSALFVSPVFGQAAPEKSLAPVVVTATRFASDPSQTPIGASVITAEEIREAGVNNVNEAIRKLGGVYGRQSFNGTQDFSIDLRGFGTNSGQNLVVLVDGVRLSENELSTALMSSIPVELVERIEIVRGGSSVLYGEGATGGVVQIITKRAAAQGTHGTVVGEVGSFGHRELRGSVARGVGGFSLDANISDQQADNFRDNNAVKQKNFSGGAQWASNEGRIAARIDIARQDSRLPGSLTLAQFEANPRQASTPNDFGSSDTDRVTLLGERHLGAFDVAAELSHREKTVSAVYVSSFGTTNYRADSRITQFSPRLRHRSEIGGMNNELVAGLDFADWERNSGTSHATQKSQAIYARDEIQIGKARIAAGARHEKFDKDFNDPFGYGTTAYSTKPSLNAWELQGKYAFLPQLDVFAKAGRSYRVANADENGFTPVPNQPLEPQTSHDIEAGITAGDAARKMTARVFRHRLKNEIFFNPVLFSNVNLDPTQRQGAELEANLRLLAEYTLSATFQHVSAKFTDGPNDGKEMVLVPRNTATLRLNWLPGSAQNASVGVQWADSQRYGNDFSNTCSGRIPSFTTLDARYARRIGAWEFAVLGTNLTDRDYFTNAFGCRSGIYPNSGRQLKVSARLDF
ncbi:MAG TPA: TonB-dependent receptor [Noviherbaspirillum sp.]|uniref:TonB-dependent receptor family protein n=1 Tax=Noviherbaspirillum sp. TaxID=1926288 RepID=UPI002B490FDE|nr:TonB-dependent receptor [Noviherbaspirillum sp.]HJV85515.1 TonB-dependent receptor [Noviherbaspirillum sp.]